MRSTGNISTGMPWWNKERGRGEKGRRFKRYKGYVTDVITDLALDFLKNRPKDKPFCLLYHHKAPHDMWEYDQKHAHLYEGIDIPEPDNLFDDYSNRGEAIKRTTEKIGMGEGLYVFLREFHRDKFNSLVEQSRGGSEKEIADYVGQLLEDLTVEEKTKLAYQAYIKSYLRCVASIDDNVGRVLDYLDRSGLADNTIVVYTSDQGFFLGEHGLFDKRFMYEESLRIPLLVRYPHEIKAGSVNRDMATNLDFAETFLDYAGVSIPKDMQGGSLRPLLNGKTPADWPMSMYYRYWMHLPHFKVAAHFGVRTKRYKLIYFYGRPMGAAGAVNRRTPPEWELFDLAKDPREMNNVYNEPSYTNVVMELKRELVKLRAKYGDEDGIVIAF